MCGGIGSHTSYSIRVRRWLSHTDWPQLPRPPLASGASERQPLPDPHPCSRCCFDRSAASSSLRPLRVRDDARAVLVPAPAFFWKRSSYRRVRSHRKSIAEVPVIRIVIILPRIANSNTHGCLALRMCKGREAKSVLAPFHRISAPGSPHRCTRAGSPLDIIKRHGMSSLDIR